MQRKVSFLYNFLSIILLTFPPRADARVLLSFSDIANQAIPGVVNIRTKLYVRRDPSLDLYGFFLNGRVPQSHSTTSLGSGVIISGDGLIVTNYHVIEDATKVEILFADNKFKVEATNVGFDRKTDLALLRVKPPFKLQPLSLGDSNALSIGDVVLAIGNPFGYSHTVTSGIISAKGRVIGTGPYDNFLQTDALIHPGNSGGPLLDIRGRVIGINTAVSAQGAGIGFAIPINTVKTVVADLTRFGKVKRPWMGVVGKNILSREDIEQTDDPTGIYGVIVSNLIIDSPAHKSGLMIGDLIMSIDDEKVFDLNALQKLLIQKKPFDSARLKLYRRGKGFIHSNIKLEEIPASEDLPNEKDLF